MAIYKCGRGDETWSAVKQLQIAVRTGLELGTSGFQDRRPNHSATLPPGNTALYMYAPPFWFLHICGQDFSALCHFTSNFYCLSFLFKILGIEYACKNTKKNQNINKIKSKKSSWSKTRCVLFSFIFDRCWRNGQ